ncbi:MAG TPA: hypothetical protein VEA38_01585 [Terriglobales bacterium]|nr:hypothetical protein [Terriglobales bacterium]
MSEQQDERRTAVFARLDALERANRESLAAIGALRQDMTALETSDATHNARLTAIETAQAAIQKDLGRLMAHFYGATGLGVIVGQALQAWLNK